MFKQLFYYKKIIITAKCKDKYLRYKAVSFENITQQLV